MIHAGCWHNGVDKSNDLILIRFRLLAYDLWGRDSETTPD
jgi:hypothetical protein